MKAFHRRVVRLEVAARGKEPLHPWLVWIDGLRPKPEGWDRTEKRIHVQIRDGRKRVQ